MDNYFNARCPRSREMIAQAKKVIPGGVQHNLAFNYPFPIVITRAEGAKLWDIDGNWYYDLLQAGGPTILGSNMPQVRERVIELLNTCGPSTGLFHEYEYKLAKKISDLVPSVEMFRMVPPDGPDRLPDQLVQLGRHRRRVQILIDCKTVICHSFRLPVGSSKTCESRRRPCAACAQVFISHILSVTHRSPDVNQWHRMSLLRKVLLVYNFGGFYKSTLTQQEPCAIIDQKIEKRGG